MTVSHPILRPSELDPSTRPNIEKPPEIGRFLALSGGNVTFKLKYSLSNGLKCNAKVKQM